MDEYIIDVVIDGKDDKLKTYCNSIYSAVDTMIGINMVEEIKSVTRTKDDKFWEVNMKSTKRLRELRSHISEIDIQNVFKNIEEVNNEI